MPFLIPLISLVVGILVGDYATGMGWWLIPVGLATAFCLYMLSKSVSAVLAFRYNRLHYIWISLLFMGIGMFSSYMHRPEELSEEWLGNNIVYVAEVNNVMSLSTGDRIEADVITLRGQNGKQYEPSHMRVLLHTNGFSTKKGDILRVHGTLTPVSDNPNYRQEGYADRMRNKGIFYTSKVTSDDIKIESFSGSIGARSSLFRDWVEAAIEKSSLNRGASGFIIAFLLGDRSFVSRDIKDSFSDSGIAHVLALSGMHVAILMGVFMAVFFPLVFLHLNIMRYWLALVGIWLFCYFSGCAPSTIRACIMTSFVVLSLTLQRRKNAGNALLAASFVILLIDPHALFDAGMQLSFLSVACILMFATQLNPVNQHLHPRTHMAVGSLLVSLAATSGTWVLVSYYFKRVPLLFLPANLLLLPFLPIYMGTAIIYVTLLMFGVDAQIIARALDSGYNVIVGIVDCISSFGSSTLDFRATLPMVLLWITGILILGYSLQKKKKVISIMVGCCFLIGSFATVPLLSRKDNDCMIVQRTFRDFRFAVYDGDSIFISELPRRAASLIRHRDVELFSIDSAEAADSIRIWLSRRDHDSAELFKNGRKRKLKKYLMLGSGSRGISFSDITGLDKFEKIILHTSLSRDDERRLIEEARDFGLQSLHSIRLDGPLEIGL